MTISMIALMALLVFMTATIFACFKLSHDLDRKMSAQFIGDLPPGCTDSDCDPDERSERERKARLREEALEDKADYEDRGQ